MNGTKLTTKTYIEKMHRREKINIEIKLEKIKDFNTAKGY